MFIIEQGHLVLIRVTFRTADEYAGRVSEEQRVAANVAVQASVGPVDQVGGRVVGDGERRRVRVVLEQLGRVAGRVLHVEHAAQVRVGHQQEVLRPQRCTTEMELGHIL